jgi:hypothetical protein
MCVFGVYVCLYVSEVMFATYEARSDDDAGAFFIRLCLQTKKKGVMENK